jgi:hypothetical protein
MPSDGKSSHCLWQGELKRAARIILDEHDFKKQSRELFWECGIVPITKRIFYHKALLMYKSN